MLSLTRKSGESILLYTADGVIEVFVTRINGNQVGIAIDAPDNVEILRSELEDTEPA